MTLIDLKAIASNKSAVPPITCIVGEGGKGKTYLALESSKYLGNTLIIDLDGGARSTDVPRYEIGRAPNELQKFRNLMITLRDADKYYDNVIIDHMGNLEELFKKDILKTEARGVETLAEMGYGRGNAKLAARWTGIFDILKKIQVEKQIHFILIGHTARAKAELKTGETYDLQKLALADNIGIMIGKEVDNIYFLSDQAVKPESGGTIIKSKWSTRYKGSVHSYKSLLTTSRPEYATKSRAMLPEDEYDVSNPEGIQEFWEDYKKTWKITTTTI